MSHTPADISRIARSLFVDGPWLVKKLQHWRPYICPYDRLIEHVPTDATMLDVGCGGGLLLGLLTAIDKRPQGIGFDYAPDAIGVAAAMATRLEQSRGTHTLKFEHRNVTDPWPTGPFDVVSIIDVMHHVPPDAQQTFFQTACQHVRPGGRLIYKDMCQRPLWRAAANRAHDLIIARQWIHYCAIAQVETWAGEQGFTLTARENINRWWYGHQLRIFDKTHSNAKARHV